MRSLEYLKISSNLKITNKGFKGLEQLNNLQSLNLSLRNNTGEILDIDFSAVNTLSNLLKLDLNLTEINFEKLLLIDFSSLTSLNLYIDDFHYQERDIDQLSKVAKYIASTISLSNRIEVIRISWLRFGILFDITEYCNKVKIIVYYFP